MKICKKCGQMKQLATRSSLCKTCHNEYTRAHYQANKEKYKAKARNHKNKMRELIRELKGVPCMDCQHSYPYWVMDFDHRDDKEFDISKITEKPRAVILAEIAKCDVVCSNCHRQRTHDRALLTLPL